ncbi:kinase-like domain-containing protein [Mycotypha africana]|uniref:kinase-like domain-containing protein n=1 Tax=Mycotypha africana TaxID=64632 RepID=UPI0023006C9A|nr:kinase-like domain-containing protein [Mycotypha africana]KAI8981869.1 kinase-like domain-containing protein [Mycotypha africana]
MTIISANTHNHHRIRSSGKMTTTTALMQKSRSEPNKQRTSINTKATIQQSIYSKRKSTGNLRQSFHQHASTTSSTSTTTDATTSSNTTINKIWRPPGHYEIPDILGNAYLKPSPPVAFDLRPTDISKQITKLETKLKKLLPKVTVRSSDPSARFTNFKEIGTGVNGAVVKANYRRKPNVKVAIKRCRLDPDREYRAAIFRELKIMASGHQNLIKLREVTICREDIWMTMDLMRCSVFAVLCQRGIPEEYTVYMACETLKALAHLHSQGILHRDVKCENLLLGWKGEVKLARTSRPNHERLGTTKWMAPEVIREEYYNEKIDMWSLGITIIEMMDRVPPHYAIKDEEELFDIIATEPSPTFTYSYPSMYMRGLVAWLLDEEPETRPTAGDALYEIEAHVQSHLLPCSTAQDLTRFLNQVLPTASD